MLLRDGYRANVSGDWAAGIDAVHAGCWAHKRGNWLFSGSLQGAKASASIYTLVDSARQSESTRSAYLEAALEPLGTCLASEVAQLPPWAWLPELPKALDRQASA